MALLGAQLVITLIVISIIQKIGPHFSIAKWFLCSTGLMRYLYPTNNELKQLAGVPKEKPKHNKHNKGSTKYNEQNGNREPETFHVPRNIDIQLETAKVTQLDVIHLRFYSEYQWLVDFTLYAAIVYVITELYQIWFSLQDEINLSIMWCMLVLGFSMKILFSLTIQYFKSEESIGERSTCIVTGFAYLLISMIVLIVDENHLEIGLEKAYSSFNENAAIFLNNQGLNSSGPASKIVLKAFLALWCGIIGALFTFPGLRMAKMHWDSLRYCQDNKLLKLLLNISFSLPFILVIMWIKPLSRDYLTSRIFSGMTAPIMTESTFESMRIALVVIAVVLRFLLMPIYLQAYLNMAYHRIEQQKKEAGRTTNIEIQKKIAAVFYYLCVVTLQYVAPLIICLYFTFIYKTLGGYSWVGGYLNNDECSINDQRPISPTASSSTLEEASVIKSAQEFHLALDSLKSVFTTDVFRGVFGFATWWTCFVWFASTSLGMIYQSYFSHS